MRTSAVLTISLPPAMVKASARAAKERQMTRSELVRDALRRYLEEIQMEKALRIADEEFRSGRAKVLPPGGLAQLMARS